MRVLNPCCCITLRSGTKIVAGVDIAVAVIFLIVCLTNFIVDLSSGGEGEHPELTQAIPPSYVTTGVWTVLVVFLVFNVGLSFLLYCGAGQYKIKYCKYYFYIQSSITSVAVPTLILLLCFSTPFQIVVLDFIFIVYRVYTLWIVYLFVAELTYLDTLCGGGKQGVAGKSGVVGGVVSQQQQGQGQDYWGSSNGLDDGVYYQEYYAGHDNHGFGGA